jgi:hypothetical protein
MQNCILLESNLTKKGKPNEDGDDKGSPPSGRYTIVHALFDALKEKDTKRKKR